MFPPHSGRPGDNLPLARTVFILVAVLYPLGYFTFTRFIPGSRDFLFGRLVIGALFAVGAALTYIPRLRPYSYRYMTFAVCALGLHYVSLVHANDFHRAYLVGAFIIFTSLIGAFNTRTSAFVFIGVYLTAVAVALRSAPKEVLSQVILGGLGLVALVQLALTETRLKMARRLQKFYLERERVNERLAATSALTALGEMAGGIGHEINNPLAIISLRLSQLEKWVKEKPDHEAGLEMVEKIVATTHRIERIVRGMRSLSRDASADPMAVESVSQLMEDTLSICAERFGQRGVALEVSVEPELKAFCRPTQISQVVLNLLNNALDAVESAPSKRVRVTARRSAAGVEISVVDSGAGIHPSVQQKLFLPFVTTKAPGRGTGLGLSISRRIVEEHGGTLELDEKSAATTFVIRLAA